MKKKRENLNVEDLKNLIESYNKNEIPTKIKKLLDHSIQEKIFLNNETIHTLKDFALPFFDIEIIKQPVPLSQYQEFISTVAKAHPELYQKEREETQNKIFSVMGHPTEFVKYLFPVYHDEFFFMKIAQKSLELFDMCLNLGDYKIPNEKTLDVLNFITKILDSFNKRDMKGVLGHLITFINNQNSFSNEEKSRISKELGEFLQVIEEYELRRKRILDNPTAFGRNILSAVNYMRSHIEYFCSYIHRLVHIKNMGNRDYRGMYYQYGSNKFWDYEFIKMCNKELKDFEALQSFLIRYSKELKKLRNISAHQVPEEIYLSKDHKMLIIPVIGKTENLEIRYSELCDIIINYGIFINKIELHPKNPYDTSEDRLGILKF